MGHPVDVNVMDWKILIPNLRLFEKFTEKILRNRNKNPKSEIQSFLDTGLFIKHKASETAGKLFSFYNYGYLQLIHLHLLDKTIFDKLEKLNLIVNCKL